MSLSWFRMDCDIASHDKMLNLVSDPSAKRWQAVSSYMFAIGWANKHGTDGHVPPTALPWVHGSPQTARLLVKYGLWEENGRGWRIHNFEQRQPTARVSEGIREAKARGARKANCIRWHGPSCDCWKRS